MTRNLKALGLALVAIFAMSAVAASGASAVQDHFRSDGTDTFLTADAKSDQVFVAQTGATQEVICKKVNVDGTISGTSVTEVTVTPTYEECAIWAVPTGAKSLASAKVTTNGCHYLFTGVTDANGHAEVHLTCPVGVTGITVDVSGLNTQCIHVIPQTLNGIHYTTEEKSGVKDITLSATVTSEIESETTHHAVVCPTQSGGTELDTTGSYTGSVTVTGFSNSTHTTPTSIWVE